MAKHDTVRPLEADRAPVDGKHEQTYVGEPLALEGLLHSEWCICRSEQHMTSEDQASLMQM